MRIRSIKPEFYSSEDVDPFDRPSWKRFGRTGCGNMFVYLLSGQIGQLVYVGITWNPFVRWTAHSRKHAWWPEVDHATLWLCRDEREARILETRCIKTMSPIRNIHQAVPR